MNTDTSQSSENDSSFSGSTAKRIRLSLMEDHHWMLTDVDQTVILRLAKEREIIHVDEDEDDSDDESPITVIERYSKQARADEDASIQRDDVIVPRSLDSSFSVENVYLMIDYIIEPQSRLFFCYKSITWRDFCTNHQSLMKRNTTYDEVRDIFIIKILPKIYTFSINDETKRAFDILKFSQSFEHIETGYLVCPMQKYSAMNMKLVRGIDYMVFDATKKRIGSCQESSEHQPSNAENANKKFVFDTQKSNPATPHIAVVVGDRNFYETGHYTKPTELIYKNMALCSAIVSHDYQIFNSECNTPEEIRLDLKSFKHDFTKTGKIPENLDAQKLSQKISGLLSLKELVVKVTNQRFSMEAMDNYWVEV